MQFTRKGHVLNSVIKVRNAFVLLCTYHLDMEYLFTVFFIYNYVFSWIWGVMLISIKHPAICSCGYVNVHICSLNKLKNMPFETHWFKLQWQTKTMLGLTQIKSIVGEPKICGPLAYFVINWTTGIPIFYCITLFKAWKCTRR